MPDELDTTTKRNKGKYDMRIKNLVFALAAAVIAMASPAMAAGGFGTFAVFGGGQGASLSGAGHLSGAFQSGSSTSSTTGQSFGHAESGFGVGVGNLPNKPDGTPGGSAAAAYGNFAGGTVVTGSISNAATTANGNGLAGAGSIGGGFGSTTLSGSGTGGFITAP